MKKAYNPYDDHESNSYALMCCYLMVVYIASVAYISRPYEVVAFACIAFACLAALSGDSLLGMALWVKRVSKLGRKGRRYYL